MDNFRPKYAPPGPENPMADYFDNRMGERIAGAGARGAMGLGMGALSFMDDSPLAAFLLRAGAIPSLALAAQNYGEAQDFRQGRDMWSNTGMPGRPVPDNQNALIQLMRFNQMYGGGGD